ncbi:hypothetical protein STEG23_012434, partial [Scotinomys teguina]
MDEENVVHTHNRVLLSGKKKNDIMKFAGKWMELENIILNEATSILMQQTPLNKDSILYHIEEDGHPEILQMDTVLPSGLALVTHLTIYNK